MDLLRRLTLGLIILCLATTGAANALGSEYQIKAAFIYNFLRFVEWPPRSSDTLVLGVLGEDPFKGSLAALEGKTVQGKRIIVQYLQTVDQAKKCQAVFIGESENNRLDKILPALKGESVLTISDVENFSERGGGITLVNDRNRVRFKINLSAIESNNLKVSSKLLQLATVVRQ